VVISQCRLTVPSLALPQIMAPTRAPSPKSSSRKSSSRKSTLDGGITKKSQHQPALSPYADFSEIVPGGGPDQWTARSPRSPSKPVSAKQKHDKILVDGVELACAKCVAGHRVGTCNHTQQPMFNPNNPGRPRGGLSNKCKCPKACNCPPNGKCKCPKDCTCVRRAYLVIYYPGPGEHKDFRPNIRGTDTWTGEFRIYHTYLGNSEGMQWPDEYLESRGYPLPTPPIEPQGSEQTPATTTTATPTTMTATPTTATPAITAAPPTPTTLPPSQAKPQSCGGGCSHIKAVAQENNQGPQPPHLNTMQHHTVTDEPSAPPANALRHGCNCGAACACIFCPQHSYNEATMASAQRMLGELFDAGRLNNVSQDIISITPTFDLSASCMGSQPVFGYTTQLPPNPALNGAPWAQMPYSAPYPSVMNGTIPTYPNVAPDGFLGQHDFSTGALPAFQEDTFDHILNTLF